VIGATQCPEHPGNACSKDFNVIKRAFSLAVIVAAGYTAAAQAQVGYYQQPQIIHPQQSNQGRIGDGIPATPVVNRASNMLRQDGTAQPQVAAPATVAPAPQPAWTGGGCDSGCAPGCDSNGCDSNGRWRNNGCHTGPGCGTDSGCGGGCDAGAGCCGVGQNYFGGGGGCGDCCDTGCGKYISVFGGWNWLHDLVDDQAPDTRFTTRDGWIAGVAFGKQINCNLRREFEFAHRRNTADQLINNGPNGPFAQDADGDIKATSAMFNLLAHPSCCIMGVRPYVGGGIGVGYIDADANVGRTLFTSDDLAFAWQLRAGVEKEINCCTSLFVEYRYFAIPNADFLVTLPPLVAGGGPVVADYEAENLVFGVNFRR
jgi:opacity protein-like surface antigen